MKKKILYVGDGRSKVNWGARATSEALYDILSKDNDIDIIPSTAKMINYCPILYGPFSTLGIFKIILSRRSGRFSSFLYKMLLKLGYKKDYVTENVEKSLDLFLKIKNEYPPLKKIYDKIEASDYVVLNGEGSMILTTPFRRDAIFFLMILKLSQKLGKKTYYLNGMISECPLTQTNHNTASQMIDAFKNCNAISVRDKHSYRLLKKISPDLNCTYIPDALFSWKYKFLDKNNLPENGDFFPWPDYDRYLKSFDFTKPYICVSGSSAAKFSSEKTAVTGYVALVNHLKQFGLPLYLVPTCNGDRFLKKVSLITKTPIIPLQVSIIPGAAILANARVFVSGRFHPSILASLGGTPCVFMGSNSHKTYSLQEVLEYENQVEYNAIPTPDDIESICNDVKRYLSQGDVRRDTISAVAKKLSDEAETVIKLVH